MLTDDEIADLFERVSQGLNPEVGDMVAQGERLGRRLRRRNRAAAAAGSALAVVVVAGIALAAGINHAHPYHSPAAAGSSVAGRHPGGRAAPARARQPGPHRAKRPGTHPAKAAGPGMTGSQLMTTLRRLLPPGSVLSHVNPYSTTRGSLEVDYNDGRGAVDLIISVTRTWTNPPLNCPHPLWANEGTRPAGALPISCAMRVLADGSIERDAVMYADEYGFYGYDIYDERPDDVTVFIQVANGINHTLPQVDRPRPPGSMAEWEAVVQNPVWHL